MTLAAHKNKYPPICPAGEQGYQGPLAINQQPRGNNVTSSFQTWVMWCKKAFFNIFVVVIYKNECQTGPRHLFVFFITLTLSPFGCCFYCSREGDISGFMAVSGQRSGDHDGFYWRPRLPGTQQYSRCHIKRRAGKALPINPSFGMTITKILKDTFLRNTTLMYFIQPTFHQYGHTLASKNLVA